MARYSCEDLIAYRKALGLSQEACGALINRTGATWSYWEKGAYSIDDAAVDLFLVRAHDPDYFDELLNEATYWMRQKLENVTRGNKDEKK